jgi:large subunit ribosomal protein L6
MSRLGKLPIELPTGVQVKVDGDFIVVKGPKGELKEITNPSVNVAITDKEVSISVVNPENKKQRALWGLYRNLVNNLVVGVTKGFEKKLQINGVGYKAAAQGRKLILNVGYSHPVEFPLPEGIDGKVEENIITLSGIDKRLLGEVAFKVRKVKEPEPYKGKGIKYLEEVIRRKEGKVAASKGE